MRMREPVRILLISALLVATASCASPPPAEIAAAPAPAVAAAPAPRFPLPFAWLFGPPPPGRLTLSNFSFDAAHIQAVITPYPDCEPRPDTATTAFELPLNGTRVIEAAAGSDVCWRRAVEPGSPPGAPGWTEWNRDYTSSGRSIDSRL